MDKYQDGLIEDGLIERVQDLARFGTNGVGSVTQMLEAGIISPELAQEILDGAKSLLRIAESARKLLAICGNIANTETNPFHEAEKAIEDYIHAVGELEKEISKSPL